MVTLIIMPLCTSNLNLLQQNPGSTSKTLVRKKHRCYYYGRQRSRSVVVAITKGSAKSSKSDEKIPSWARPDSDEPPPWARDGAKGSSESTVQIPFFAYLLASAVTAIAAVTFQFLVEAHYISVLVKYHGLDWFFLRLLGLGYTGSLFFFYFFSGYFCY